MRVKPAVRAALGELDRDLPLLARVTDPVAVDPDDTLRAHAARAGWPIVSLA